MINKDDLAELVGSDLSRMRTDARDSAARVRSSSRHSASTRRAATVAAWVRERVELFRRGDLSTTIGGDTDHAHDHHHHDHAHDHPH